MAKDHGQQRYDFSGPLIGTDGEEIKIGEEVLLLWHKLSEGLINSKEGPAIKFLDWACTVRKEPHELFLDRQDAQMLRTWLQNNGQLVLIRARLLEAMDESENPKSTKTEASLLEALKPTQSE